MTWFFVINVTCVKVVIAMQNLQKTVMDKAVVKYLFWKHIGKHCLINPRRIG